MSLDDLRARLAQVNDASSRNLAATRQFCGSASAFKTCQHAGQVTADGHTCRAEPSVFADCPHRVIVPE